MIQGVEKKVHFPLSANKGVKQQVMRFTPFSTPINLRAIKPPSQITVLGGGFI